MLQIKNNNIDSWVVKELLWRRKQPPFSISLGFSALFLHKEPSPLRPKLLVVKSSLFRLLSPVGPWCTKTRQSSEAQRNALLRAHSPNHGWLVSSSLHGLVPPDNSLVRLRQKVVIDSTQQQSLAQKTADIIYLNKFNNF